MIPVKEEQSRHRDGPGCNAPFAEGLRVVSLSRGISHFLDFPKSQRGRVMPFPKAQPTPTAELRDLAQDWGKVVARRAFGEAGPRDDLAFDTFEQIAVDAAHALTRRAIEQFLRRDTQR